MAVRERASPWPFAALVGMAAACFLYGVAYSLVPWWVAGLLTLAWIGMLVLVLRWFGTRPRATVAVPVVAVALWFTVIVGGSRLLGWT